MEYLKIAKVTPVYKSGGSSSLRNYRPFSVLPCFSKMLKHIKRIIHTWLYNYLQENNILYSKQFGFHTAHSTDHAIIQLVDQIYGDFEKNKYTLGMFTDYSSPQNTIKKNGNIWYRWNYTKMVWKLFNKQKTVYSDKQYQKHRFKRCCMQSS